MGSSLCGRLSNGGGIGNDSDCVCDIRSDFDSGGYNNMVGMNVVKSLLAIVCLIIFGVIGGVIFDIIEYIGKGKQDERGNEMR